MIQKHTQSMKTHLILMFVGTTIFIYFSLTLVLQHLIERHFFEQDYQHISEKFQSINLRTLQKPEDILEILSHNSAYLWLLRESSIIGQNSEIPLPAEQLAALSHSPNTQDDALEWQTNGMTLRAFDFPIDDQHLLVIGINIRHHLIFLDNLNRVLLSSTLLAILISSLYGFFIVRSGLKPIKVLGSHIREITPDSLSKRIPSENLPIELQELSEIQNKMLDRIEQGFHRLGEFSSDIAHELRTPLSNMNTQIQVMLSAQRSKEEYQDALESNLEELNRIIKTMNDVLYIARAENSLARRNDQTIQLAEELHRIIEFFSIIAEEKDITIVQSGDASLWIDKVMFERAINNLLSNAIRHADNDSTIKIDVDQTTYSANTNTVNIRITNQGETIPSDSLPYLFDRFYRVDKSRQHKNSIGAGLGLSITQSIVHAYQGQIDVTSENGTTTFALHFNQHHS
ncbi:heavy metal sensor histidine kinase [Litoribrevibacter albus]|uniref:Sensor protein n=1 Tax=Litoribrevibacter albus TaxID=1473156 RepID=A0AA37S704_9GAMM|nr:heavy metal sensor histidine kinase [Litoribrevibacter albus]GLQ30261.1 two-component sensor histidine kinase [Litoribrevibacter albus]